MKVVMTGREGEAFFHLIKEMDLPNLDVVHTLTPEETLAAVADAEIFFGFPNIQLTDAAPALRWIQAPSAGVEHIVKIPAILERNIAVTNSRGAHGPSIGEHAIALLLALTRELHTCFKQQQEHVWERNVLYRSNREVMGMTMGILGYGALGRGIAQRAHGFEMKLLAVDARAVDGHPYVDEVWPSSRLDEMLELVDVLVVATPLTDLTRNLIDADALARMKPDAYLVVVSRGGIVNEDALETALRSGKLAGAALDVTATEPLPADSPLWDVPNLILTPHTAGASAPKERRVVEIFRENIIRYHAGDPLLNQVDPETGF